MKDYKLEVYLYQSKRFHGTKGPKAQKSGTGAARKVAQLLMKGKQISPQGNINSNNDPNIIKKLIWSSGEGTSPEEDLKTVKRLTGNFERLKQDPVKQKKSEYAARKAELINSYSSKFGLNWTATEGQAYLAQLKEYSFEYLECWMLVKIYSNEDFGNMSVSDNSEYSFMRSFRTRRIYRMDHFWLRSEDYDWISQRDTYLPVGFGFNLPMKVITKSTPYGEIKSVVPYNPNGIKYEDIDFDPYQDNDSSIQSTLDDDYLSEDRREHSDHSTNRASLIERATRTI